MHLLHLPGELILYILGKINVVDALFRLNGIDERLDKYLFDSLYVRELDFTRRISHDETGSMDELIIDQVVTIVLPRINEKITKLTIESAAVDRVLGPVKYSNVVSLSLKYHSRKTLCQHLRENERLIELLRNQIKYLNVDIIDEVDDDTTHADDSSDAFQLIVSLSHRLMEMTFYQTLSGSRALAMDGFSSKSPVSSTLSKLDLYLETFDDCLSILDGRFQSLSHCSLSVNEIISVRSKLTNKDHLTRLKFFSLRSYTTTPFYDDLVVPLLKSMLNLDELRLSLITLRTDLTRAINENDLVNRVLIHLHQLRTFHFSIYNSFAKTDLSADQFSRIDDQQREMIEKTCRKVGSYFHSKQNDTIFGYHIYSHPYVFNEMIRLSHTFSTDIFIKVQTLFLQDFVPWDFEYLERINKCFPSLKYLLIGNPLAQKNKPLLNNNHEEGHRCITFARLRKILLSGAHLDYIEQFLNDRYTRLPQLRDLNIKYAQLVSVTKNFTNEETRNNCSKIEELTVDEVVVLPEHFSFYFPSLKSMIKS